MKAGHAQREIAKVIGRSPSTISRELRRNKGLRGDRPIQANRLAQCRGKEKVHKQIPATTWARVEELLWEDWSPEQISGWLVRVEGLIVSHEWIYQYVYEDKRRGGDLHRHLRCQRPRRKRYGSNDRRGRLRNRTSIEERPEVVEQRARIGDWEVDTVIGRPGGAPLPVEPDCAGTGQDGQRGHPEAAPAPGSAGAHPYHSWERSLNENTNCLVRQYLPKGSDLDKLTPIQVETIMNKLNNRLQKCLEFKTPNQVFFGIDPPLALCENFSIFCGSDDQCLQSRVVTSLI